MALTVVQLLAVILIALALVPGAAHLAALPNKIGLPVDPYFTVQAIYRGWSLFGVVFFAALGATVTLAAMVRARPSAFRRACLGAAGVAAALVVFFTWTFPANRATANWTRVPPDWERLRLQWEYSHAAGALLMLVALGAVTLSILAPDAPRGDGRGTPLAAPGKDGSSPEMGGSTMANHVKTSRSPRSIRDVMTPAPRGVDSGDSVVQAARAMRDHDIGDVLVTENGRLVGVVTDRDLVIRALADGREPSRTTVGEVCSRELSVLGPEDSVDQAVDLMRRGAIRRLPIVEDGRPVGIVSLGDLARARDPESALGGISQAPPNR